MMTLMTSGRILLCSVMILIFSAGKADAQVFVSEDFNGAGNPGLPAGWTSTPASLWVTGAPDTIAPNALSSLNFTLHNASHTKVTGINGSLANADDAKITSPVFSLPSSAVNAVLEYDISYFGLQSNNTPPQTESLIFIVSTDGGTTWSDVSFVAPVSDPTNNVWETRALSMGAYAGQSNLKFGFRYNNEGGTLIGAVLDNIKLVNGIDGAVVAALAGDHPDPSTGIGYQLSGSNATLTGTIKNTGSGTINSYYIRYKVGAGTVQTSPLITAPLAPLAFAGFPPGLSVSIPANTSYTIKAWIEAAGDVDHNNDTATVTTFGVPGIPLKRPVFEEGTGTWCGWCPQGAVFMDRFAVNHPNGDAAQIAVHNNDPMTLSAYNSYMSNYANGFPNLVVDRTNLKDPKKIDTVFAAAKNHFGFADFNIGAPAINGNIVSIPVSIKPVVMISNPKLALVITESNVRGSGSNWAQNNYYSGGGSGAMGGWENAPPSVPDVYFHFVARSITPAAGGGADSLPSTLMAGTTYQTTLTATLNSGWKKNDLQYIALLINGNNTSVMNSAFTSLPALTPALGHGTAVIQVESDVEQAVLYPNPASGKSYLNCKMKTSGKALLTVTDIAGRTVYSKSLQVQPGYNTIELGGGHFTTGSYFIHFTTEKANVVLRLLTAP